MKIALPKLPALGAHLPRRAAVNTLVVACQLYATKIAAANDVVVGGEIMYGDEKLMAPKAHGTTEKPVQSNLRWNVARDTADRICSFNRHYAEYAGYWKSTDFLQDVREKNGEITYYDSVSGKPLFVAPRGRSMKDFLVESASHGWPSFRDDEVVWANVRVLRDGEAVSVDGTHLGHNLPDRAGNRYCINLVSVAGLPETKTEL